MINEKLAKIKYYSYTNLTDRQRKSIAKWLREKAEELVSESPSKYADDYSATYYGKRS